MEQQLWTWKVQQLLCWVIKVLQRLEWDSARNTDQSDLEPILFSKEKIKIFYTKVKWVATYLSV